MSHALCNRSTATSSQTHKHARPSATNQYLWQHRGDYNGALARFKEAQRAKRYSDGCRHKPHLNAGHLLLEMGRPEEALLEYMQVRLFLRRRRRVCPVPVRIRLHTLLLVMSWFVRCTSTNRRCGW